MKMNLLAVRIGLGAAAVGTLVLLAGCKDSAFAMTGGGTRTGGGALSVPSSPTDTSAAVINNHSGPHQIELNLPLLNNTHVYAETDPNKQRVYIMEGDDGNTYFVVKAKVGH